MNKLEMQSKNIVDENIEFLAQKFPNCIVEARDEDGKLTKMVDFDLLKQELSKVVVEGNQERYTMTWPDKKQAILTANAPISKTLRPCREESVDFDNTKNLYIEGDNLDVLKLLRETYLNKIKMIYIDPPYNTGSDFVYEDDFAINTEEYLQRSNQVDDQGNRMVTNNDSNGRFHTDWLNMIYPRLKLAKDLLTDDGVIFISIDDNECANLKKICDEIFGKKNAVGEIIRKTKSMTGDDGCGFNLQHENLLIYAKNKENLKLKGEEKDYSNYSNPDNDPNGDWCTGDPSAKSGGDSTYFEIINPYTNKIDLPPTGRYWAFSKSTLEKYIETGKIVFKKEHKPTERGFIFKRYKKDATSINNPLNSLFIENHYMNQSATTELNKMFEDSVFSYPKPVRFVFDLIKSAVNSGDIVMDFFSGSATTAHAVMQLNAEENLDVKYILVQLPENCENSKNFDNICDIGKERIRRAGNVIIESIKNSTIVYGRDKNKKLEPTEENKNALKMALDNIEDENYNKLVGKKVPDIGFRCLKLDTSNMKDIYYKPAELNQASLLDYVTNIKEDRTAEDLLFQVMLDMGVMLSSEIKIMDIKGKKVFNVNDGNLVCCFDNDLSDDVVTEIAKMKPLYAVFRDSSMKSDSVAVNFDQIFETYSHDTTRRII